MTRSLSRSRNPSAGNGGTAPRRRQRYGAPPASAVRVGALETCSSLANGIARFRVGADRRLERAREMVDEASIDEVKTEITFDRRRRNGFDEDLSSRDIARRPVDADRIGGDERGAGTAHVKRLVLQYDVMGAGEYVVGAARDPHNNEKEVWVVRPGRAPLLHPCADRGSRVDADGEPRWNWPGVPDAMVNRSAALSFASR